MHSRCQPVLAWAWLERTGAHREARDLSHTPISQGRRLPLVPAEVRLVSVFWPPELGLIRQVVQSRFLSFGGGIGWERSNRNCWSCGGSLAEAAESVHSCGCSEGDLLVPSLQCFRATSLSISSHHPPSPTSLFPFFPPHHPTANFASLFWAAWAGQLNEPP